MPASRLSASHCAGRARRLAPSSSAKGTGAKVRNSITAARRQAAAAQEQQQRARGAPAAQRQRGVQAVGDAQPLQQVGEERRVGVGPRQDHAHLLEGHAARGLAQQPPHDAAHLGRLAGRGQQLDRVVARRPPARRLEERAAQPLQAGRRGRGRVNGAEHRLAPIARARCPAAATHGRRRAAGRPAGRGPASSARADGRRARPGAPLRRIELELVHQDLGARAARRAGHARGRRGRAPGSAKRLSIGRGIRGRARPARAAASILRRPAHRRPPPPDVRARRRRAAGSARVRASAAATRAERHVRRADRGRARRSRRRAATSAAWPPSQGRRAAPSSAGSAIARARSRSLNG